MKKLAMIMDPLESIYPQKDSSFAMLLEAKARGYENYYLQPKDLYLINGLPYAKVQKAQFLDLSQNYFELEPPSNLPLAEFNFIFMRSDPPLTMNYIHTTQILDLAEKAGVLVINKPQSLRDFNEKLFISYFPQCCVPSLVSCDRNQIENFLEEQGDIICKPLDGMGGRSIFRVQRKDPNLGVIIETLTQYGQSPCMSQRYIPEIKAGDKRILLINGEPVPYSLARIPKVNETRANLVVGGTGIAQKLTERDHWICEQLKSTLQVKGLYFVGIDVIGDYLTEINITSPTCIRELDRQCGLNIAGHLFDFLESLS
jgi:glutathione synthase